MKLLEELVNGLYHQDSFKTNKPVDFSGSSSIKIGGTALPIEVTGEWPAGSEVGKSLCVALAAAGIIIDSTTQGE